MPKANCRAVFFATMPLCAMLLLSSCGGETMSTTTSTTKATRTPDTSCRFDDDDLDRAAFSKSLAAASGSATTTAADTVPARVTDSPGQMSMGFQQDGLLFAPDSDPDATFARMRSLGASVVRITLHWQVIARNCENAAPGSLGDPEATCYDWTAYDRVIEAAERHGIDVIVTLSGVPDWVNAGTDSNKRWHVGVGREFAVTVARYAEFAEAAGRHYRAAGSPIDGWTIWNEPNSKNFWKPFRSKGANAAPRLYARMFNSAAAALKRADPAALVAAGPTGPKSVGMKPGTYIAALQQAGIDRSLLDAWAHNPYPGERRSPREAALRAPSIGIGNFNDLIAVLDRHASTRNLPIWATEFAYESHPQEPREALSVPLALQGQYLAEGFEVLWRTKRVRYAIWYVMSDPAGAGYPNEQARIADWQSGVLEEDATPKPAAWMFRRPIAVSDLDLEAGDRLSVWAQSNVGSPASLQLKWDWGDGWKTLPGQQRTDNVVVARAPLRRKGSVRVALFDDGSLERSIACRVRVR